MGFVEWGSAVLIELRRSVVLVAGSIVSLPAGKTATNKLLAGLGRSGYGSRGRARCAALIFL